MWATKKGFKNIWYMFYSAIIKDIPNDYRESSAALLCFCCLRRAVVTLCTHIPLTQPVFRVVLLQKRASGKDLCPITVSAKMSTSPFPDTQVLRGWVSTRSNVPFNWLIIIILGEIRCPRYINGVWRWRSDGLCGHSYTMLTSKE